MSFVREPNAEPIKGYRLIEPLGSGGFGEVWKCEAPGGIFKAIKFVYGNLNSLDAEGVRAEQELQALQQIKEVRHLFVLSMDRIEIVEGELVIVMELADKSLHDEYVECQGAGMVGIPRDALLRYVRDASEALDHMIEKHNLLHLDIKPRNLFLISDRVKVADFGLVKHLERHSASGLLGAVTPLYAPPETINNILTPFSDQYSLAIVYQELLTGQRPFNGKNARQLAFQHLHDEPELRALPEAERPVVARALSKDPDKRWPNCLSFVRALYQASQASRVESLAREERTKTKTMVDTMEDMLLEMPSGPTPTPGPRPAEDIEVSQLGITIAQPQTGALRPTLILGLGGFGRRALIDLRCRFLDRFGDLAKIPLFKFLYIETDAEAAKSASRGAPEVALADAAVIRLPLQPASNYRRRLLDHLFEWLPREKLHAISRALQTQGSRALGRLAFADSHLRLLTRLRRDLEQVTHPDTLYQSVNQTGLALRENLPRIYVIAAAGGGSSGILPDLGYGLRRLLKTLRFPEAEVIALLLCGAPNDPATPSSELANLYATLTELNHFGDPGTHFNAQYTPDGPKLQDEGAPFASTYLLPLPHRTPESLRDAVAHLGSYLFHDMTTPLGLRLDKVRHARAADGATPFRSFGTFAVWFPRGLLLRLAARQVCSRLLQSWHELGELTVGPEVEAATTAAADDPELQFEALRARIEQLAKVPVEGTQPEDLNSFLTRLEEQSRQSTAVEDPASWSQQALGRVQEWIGSTTAGSDSSWRKSRLHRVLTAITQQVAKEWDERLSRVAFGLMEHRGRRLAAAEAGLERLVVACQNGMQAPRAWLQQQGSKTEQLCDQLSNALESCGSGFSLFSSKARRLRTFMEALVGYARQRLAEEMATAVVQFFGLLLSRFEERLRELSFCRQRLRALQEKLEGAAEDVDGISPVPIIADASLANTPPPSAESYYDMIRESDTVRVVLPDGEKLLERAADRFVASLAGTAFERLDEQMQERVLAPLGGLHHLCTGSGDLLKGLAGPLIAQAATCLGEMLPVTDVAEVEFSAAAAKGKDIKSRALVHFQRAVPLVADAQGGGQHAFLLVPASDAGKSLGDQIKQAIPGIHLVKVSGQADLMFCREQGNLKPEDLKQFLQPSRAAYQELSPSPLSSPHSRFDVLDWVPLDP